MHNIRTEKYEQALNLIDKVYDKSEDRNAILESLKKQCETNKSSGSTQLPYWDALFGPKYLKSTLIFMVITSLV